MLADEDGAMFVGGGFHFTTPSIYNVPRIMSAFRNGGGIPYDEIGGELPCAIERFFRPGYVHFLASDWLTKIPGLTDKLTNGAQVCDVGCGRGQSTVEMAKAYPKSEILGIDYHRDSIGAAMKLAEEAGVSNTRFIAAPAEEIPRDRKYDCSEPM